MHLPPAPDSDGMGWALIPLLTVGIGAPASFAYAALRKRSTGLGVAAAGYTAGVAASWEALVDSTSSQAHLLGLLLIFVTWIASTSHAIIARPRLYPVANPRDRMNQQVVEVARHRRTLRDRARRMVAEDPGLAHELRIGRPDQPRAYDDGGLIDVNHAPPPTLALLPGLTDELIERIVRLRAEQGPFVSAEELAVHADLPPDIVPGIAEYAIFIH